MKAWLLKWLVGSTTAAALLSPQISPPPLPPPPEIIEVPVAATDNRDFDKALANLQSSYNQRIQSLTDKISKLEKRIAELERRPPIVERVTEQIASAPAQTTNIDIPAHFSKFDKRIASLEGRVGLYETSYMQLNESYQKILDDQEAFTKSFNAELINAKIQKLCDGLRSVVGTVFPFSGGFNCQGLWWE